MTAGEGPSQQVFYKIDEDSLKNLSKTAEDNLLRKLKVSNKDVFMSEMAKKIVQKLQGKDEDENTVDEEENIWDKEGCIKQNMKEWKILNIIFLSLISF